MSVDRVKEAVNAGFSGNDPMSKLGLFGMGFNVATARIAICGAARALVDRHVRGATTRLVSFRYLGIHLFGIRHADALWEVDLPELVAAAGVPKPYATEIRKGMRLAEYVSIK